MFFLVRRYVGMGRTKMGWDEVGRQDEVGRNLSALPLQLRLCLSYVQFICTIHVKTTLSLDNISGFNFKPSDSFHEFGGGRGAGLAAKLRNNLQDEPRNVLRRLTTSKTMVTLRYVNDQVFLFFLLVSCLKLSYCIEPNIYSEDYLSERLDAVKRISDRQNTNWI